MGKTIHGGTVISIWQRDKHKCWICTHQVPREEASRDHVKPRGLRGYDKSKNYRCAHKLCNNARGMLDEVSVRHIQLALPNAPAETIRTAMRYFRRNGTIPFSTSAPSWPNG